MNAVYTGWFCSMIVLLGSCWVLGTRVIERGPLGILIDTRGRYSLTQLQVVAWSLAILSLMFGVAIGRLVHGAPDGALGFAIPEELLAAMGIAVGSTVASMTVKASKDASHPERVAASDGKGEKPSFSQVFLVEEGEAADRIIDVTKFQSFWITLLVLTSYVSMAISAIRTAGATDLTALPGFSSSFLTLLGISHAAYVAGKLPNREGTPRGLTLSLLRQGAVAESGTAPTTATTPPTYIPRRAA